MLYQRIKKFTLYSFHRAGHPECEFDDFLSRFDTAEHADNINSIAAALREFAQRGIDKRRFRPGGEGPVDALLAGPGQLRLYVIPCSRNALIVGNGCFKDERRLQEVPECRNAWELMVALDKELRDRMQDKSIRWQVRADRQADYLELTGDMHFEFGRS
ncbi:hypothetical protein [Chitinophaga alhagiae]|uniref:hypothetical protein n=1 Tax=Chitinophaga alhagiae TaxID=2203219 RepID=UPI000E5B167A|nr:hypothetical protein [Chitinophaga alhagiae]